MSEIERQPSVNSTWGAESVHHDQIIFENVADQYAKGEAVTVHLTTLPEAKLNTDEDQVGLIRVGSNNMKECLAYAPIQLGTSTRHGIATFASAELPVTDDEFYQFCYVNSKGKCLGSSIPFQLNCSPDDMDLLTSTLMEAALDKPSNTLIAMADRDNDDLVVVHTKNMLTEEKLRQENRQLSILNRSLEQQHEELKMKLELVNLKSAECIHKIQGDIEALAASHKTTVEELTSRQRSDAKLRLEHDATLVLCQEYQSQSLEFAERCRNLEESHVELSNEAHRLRSQLSLTSQLVDEQSNQIVDLEKSLIESNDLLKTANQNHLQLEQKIRDLRLTAEKHQLTLQGQLDAYKKQASQQENQLHALESANSLLKEELKSVTKDKAILVATNEEEKLLCKELQQQIDDLHEQHRLEKDVTRKELNHLRKQLEQSAGNHHETLALTTSVNEIKKRCLKHQKSEIEVKKQLSVYQESVTDLQRQIHDLTERLLAGGDEYKALYRKYIALERTLVRNASAAPKSNPTTLSVETGLNEDALVSLLRSSYELQQQDQQHKVEEEQKNVIVPSASPVQQEIGECPMCYWEFPAHHTLEQKKEHIEAHFN